MKREFVCSVSMGPRALNVFSDTNCFVGALKVTGHFIPSIPGWRCTEEPVNSSIRLYVVSSGHADLQVAADGLSLTTYGRPGDLSDGDTIAYLAYFLLEIDRQRHWETTIHGAACSSGGRGVLLLGERASGKTSIVLELCTRYGYKLIGNDLLIVRYEHSRDVALACAGTKIFGIRYAVARSRFPRLLPLFGTTVLDGWREKVFCLPDELGLQIEENEVPIDAAFFCHLGDCGGRGLYSNRIADSWIRFNLYENLSRYIKGSALVHSLNGPQFTNIAYTPPVDCKQFHSFRVSLLNHLVDTVKLTAVGSPDLGDICAAVHETVQSRGGH